MPGFSRKEIWKITEMKDGCVKNTKKIKSLWLPIEIRSIEQENEIAKSHGGDILANTTDYHFGRECLE